MIEQVEEVSRGLSAHSPARRALAPAADGQPSVQIVGRTRELQLIETLLDTTRPSYPIVLHLSGPGGIGKTILLSHLVGRAAHCGYLTLRGRAAEFGTKEAFGLFYDALEPALASLDPRALRRLDEEQQTELAGVFPALKEHSDEHRVGPASGSMDRYRLHRAVAALIDLLASGRPVLLAVDDLHWADPASVELLLYLLRRPPATPLLAAVASRSSQLQPEAAALLEDTHRDSRGIALELAPLTAREAAALFPSDLPTALAERIYTESGGNPFFLMELMRAAHSDELDVARPVAIEDGHVPATVTSAIARECNRVSPTARELIMAAALLGDPFEPELAGEIVSIEHPAPCGRWMSSYAPSWSKSPTSPGPSAFVTRSCDQPSTTRRGADGGVRLMRARPRSLLSGARRPPRAQVTSSSRRRSGTARRSRSSARRATRRRPAHRPPPRAGSAPPYAFLETGATTPSGSS